MDMAEIGANIRSCRTEKNMTMEELGKAVGSDEKNHKTTYVTLEGIKKAGEDVKELTKEALNLLMELPGEQEFLRELLLSLCTRRK